MATHSKNPEFPQTRPTLEPNRSPGTQNARQSAESAVQNFSIVMSGPIRDLLLRFRWVRFTLPNVSRRIIAAVAITWFPLLLLSLGEGLAFGHQVRIPFLYDFAMYGRFLLGLPLLLYAEVVIDPAIRQSVAEFVDARLVPDQELPEFENILRSVQRMRDSWILEVILLLLAFFPVFVFQHEWATGGVTSWHTTKYWHTVRPWGIGRIN